MSTPLRSARDRAREDVAREIRATARRHLAAEGAAGLSLRAVARELGVASSAVYRYYATRDALLTALIVEAYDALGLAAEEADTAARADGSSAGVRWLATCRAVREWALAHPQEFALVYGSPVPGYAAPQDTVDPAVRLPRVMAHIVAAAAEAGDLDPRTRTVPRTATTQARAVAAWPVEPAPDVVERALTMWVGLVGALTFELFGHLANVVDDPAVFFDSAVAVGAEAVGLTVPLQPPGPGRAPDHIPG